MPKTKAQKMWATIRCFFGWHNFRWTLKIVNGVSEPITGKIADRAICTDCGIKYRY